MNYFALFLASLLLMNLNQLARGESFYISEFSPRGAASDVKQVKIKFSSEMVPFGELSRAAPVSWDCGAKGEGVWLDTKTWVLNFPEKLAAGMECAFTILPNLKDLKGNSTQGAESFKFSTSGPTINGIRPYEGATIEEDQNFVLVLSGPIDIATVLKHVFFKVEGLRSPVGINVIEGPKRAQILEKTYLYGADKTSELLVVSAKNLFPSSARVSLVWDKGVQSPSGTTTDKDKIYNYMVREPFRITAHCTRDNQDKNCNPLGRVAVDFNSSVLVKDLGKIKITDGSGKAASTSISEWQRESGRFNLIEIKGPYKPGDTYTINVAHDLRDESNRPLDNALRLPVTMTIDEYPPLAKFAGDFGVIEYAKDAAIPITVRNLESETLVKQASITAIEASLLGRAKLMIANMTGFQQNLEAQFSQIIRYMEKLDKLKYSREKYTKAFLSTEDHPTALKDLVLPKVEPPKEMEVVGIPVQQPGYYQFEIQSKRLASTYLTKQEGEVMYVPAGFMVTNLGVHLKLGRENSLIWVTTLNDATPVKKAKITVMSCLGKSVWSGTTNADGVAQFSGDLAALFKETKCEESGDDEYHYDAPSHFYVFAQKGEDFAFVKNTWNSGIENWRWSYEYPYSNTYPLTAHTILDRSLLRAGETVHMKHILRRESVDGFKFGDVSVFDTVELRHYGSGDKFQINIKWDPNAHAESVWPIPKEAKLGHYDIYLTSSKNTETKSVELSCGGFEVQEFRVPLTKGYLKVPPESLVGVHTFPVSFGVQYLAGDGVGKLPVTLNIYRSKSLHHLNKKGFENYNFNIGTVSINAPSTQDEPRDFDQVPLTLDASGNNTHKIDVPISTMKLSYNIELSYTDPNGEVRTFANQKDVLPNTWNVGISTTIWLLKDKNLDITSALLDEYGNPLNNKRISLHLYKIEVLSHRKKLAGGIYSYENQRQLKDLGPLCSGETNTDGKFVCKKMIKDSGNIYVQVQAANKDGTKINSHLSLWVPGDDKNTWWFEGNESDRMDVLAVKEEYSPGDTAEFQIRSPFRKAKALVTVEREGILDYQTIDLDASGPTHALKVKANYAPNVYVSVLAVRGRNDEEKPTAMVDLGKPAYKLGKAMIKVGWKSNRLVVDLKADREVYQVREKAKIVVRVKSEDDSPLPSGGEVAIAAVDEGLLELKRNESWNILDVMMNRRPLAVATATAQMQIVGKRHFGLKAIGQGGGGGLGSSSNPRELFDTLLLWQAKVPLDSKGQARVEVPLNDSLTAFRIAAVATAGPGKFGSGTTLIRSNKDLIIYAGLAPIIRVGDEAHAKMTLRNTTDKNMNVHFVVMVKELGKKIYDDSIQLNASESRDLTIIYNADEQHKLLTFETTATVNGKILDQLVTQQRVVEVVPTRVQQAIFSQLEQPLALSVQKPIDAVEGKGGIKVSAQASAVSSLDSVRSYAANYPYTCFEQKISKLVMLDDVKGFQTLVKTIDSYIDTQGFLKYFPAMNTGSPVLTSYVMQILALKAWQLPTTARDRILAALHQFAEGKVGVPQVATHNYTFERLSAIESLTRFGKAQPSLLDSINIDANDWPTSAVVDLLNIVHRLPAFTKRDALMEQCISILRARVDLSGSKIGFHTEAKDHLSWMMASPDLNAIKLLGSALEFGLWREDLGRYVKGALARMDRGHWDLTTANAWGMAVLQKFSETHEKTPLTGKTLLNVSAEKREISWNANKAGPGVVFPWTANVSELNIHHDGNGKPWVLVQSLAAMNRKQSVGNGFSIKKSFVGLEKTDLNQLKAGDLIRVKLTVNAQSRQDWVVIDDPIPAGSTVLGKGLGGESLAAQSELNAVIAEPTYKELSHESVRAYYERVSDGELMFEYTLRLNNGGHFNLPATRVEAMYAPEVFAEVPNAAMDIKD